VLAADILRKFAERGVVISLTDDGENLDILGFDKLTDEEKHYIRCYKTELLWRLRHPNGDPDPFVCDDFCALCGAEMEKVSVEPHRELEHWQLMECPKGCVKGYRLIKALRLLEGYAAQPASIPQFRVAATELHLQPQGTENQGLTNMKISVQDAFPSKWLSVNDFDGDEITVTLAENALEYQDFRQQGTDVPARKPVVYFRSPRGTKPVKPLVCNKGNFETLIKLLGDDTDEWTGKQITLGVEEVEAFGKRTLGVRVRQRLPKPKPAAVKSVQRELPEEPDGWFDNMQDDDSQEVAPC